MSDQTPPSPAWEQVKASEFYDERYRTDGVKTTLRMYAADAVDAACAADASQIEQLVAALSTKVADLQSQIVIGEENERHLRAEVERLTQENKQLREEGLEAVRVGREQVALTLTALETAHSLHAELQQLRQQGAEPSGGQE